MIKHALSFAEFIFESQFGQERLDFCLDLFREYRKAGKGMQDLPQDIQQCIQSSGQTDLSRTMDLFYDRYLENGSSFEGMEDVVNYSGKLSNIGMSKLMPKEESADPQQMEFLSTILVGYSNSIQYAIVPERQGENHLIIAGRKASIDKVFDDLIEILGEEKLAYIGGEDYYTEIAAYLNNTEVELLNKYLDELGGFELY